MLLRLEPFFSSLNISFPTCCIGILTTPICFQLRSLFFGQHVTNHAVVDIPSDDKEQRENDVALNSRRGIVATPEADEMAFLSRVGGIIWRRSKRKSPPAWSFCIQSSASLPLAFIALWVETQYGRKAESMNCKPWTSAATLDHAPPLEPGFVKEDHALFSRRP
jgi:hypothetical protein